MRWFCLFFWKSTSDFRTTSIPFQFVMVERRTIYFANASWRYSARGNTYPTSLHVPILDACMYLHTKSEFVTFAIYTFKLCQQVFCCTLKIFPEYTITSIEVRSCKLGFPCFVIGTTIGWFHTSGTWPSVQHLWKNIMKKKKKLFWQMLQHLVC